MNIKTLLGSVLWLMSALPSIAEQIQPPREPQGIEQICAGGRCGWEKVATCEGFIEGINFDAQGRMFMVGYASGAILQVENGVCSEVGENAGSPNGARFATDGSLLVADRFAGLVSVDTRTGERTVLHRGDGVSMFRGLNDLAFDPEGGLYMTEPYGSNALNRTGKVYYLAPDEGARPTVFADGLAYPNGVALSPDGGRLYVAEFAMNRILSIPTPLSSNTADVAHVFAQLVGGLGPDGLLVDDAGNLFAAHFFAGEVVVMDRNAMPYGAIALPEGAGAGPTNLAFHEGYLYVTEAFSNDVWRVALDLPE